MTLEDAARRFMPAWELGDKVHEAQKPHRLLIA